MPQLNFQKQFVTKIFSGEKTFTLRVLRKDGHDAKAGQRLYMFTGLRSKQCKKIAEKPCMFAVTIQLAWHSILIPTIRELARPQELNLFSRLDGFEDYEGFCQFHEIAPGMKEKQMRLIAWITRDELKQLFKLS